MHYLIELYRFGKQIPFFRLRECPFQPNKGELINIEKVTYEIIGRWFTVDYAGTINQEMRLNLIVRVNPKSASDAGGKDE